MALIELQGVGIHFGNQDLLINADFSLQRGERVALVGRNGCGKSTLIRLLSKALQPDDGRIRCDAEIRVARLDQEVPVRPNTTVFEDVAEELGEVGKWLARRYAEQQRQATPGHKNSPADEQQDVTLQQGLSEFSAWEAKAVIDSTLSHLQLVADQMTVHLSGGMKRRLSLARALVRRPDVLLLDEPTNHLDMVSIQWLEGFLKKFQGGLLFVTHDRRFLQNLATRIVELDRGQLYSFQPDYGKFLQLQAQRFAVEQQRNDRFDKKLKEEETWIRKGIQARRTRNEGRVRALKKMRRERQQRLLFDRTAKLQLQHSKASGKMVAELDEVCVCLDGDTVISGFSTRILKGDKIGIIGPNGCGKTTLLNTLLGKLKPSRGSVRLGAHLDIAYFQQHREQIDESLSVIDNVAEGQTEIHVNGKPRHIISYLGDFLFSPQRALTPAAALSGGEKSRLLLAKLFTRPANLLILDEPTNDLDIETLELLESLLVQSSATILVVSHDRYFLDNVVTSTLVFEDKGKVAEFVGGYSDWQRQQPSTDKPSVARKEKKSAARNTNRIKKLGYKDQRELEALPAEIERLEQAIDDLQLKMSATDFYTGSRDRIVATRKELDVLETQRTKCYGRWEELEALQGKP